MEVINTGTVRWIYADGQKPPLKLRNLMERVSQRHPRLQLVIRWMRCGRGCAHGRAFMMVPSSARDLCHAKGENIGSWEQYIRLYYEKDETSNEIVLLHEAAHHIAGCGTGHGTQFYRALITEARAEGLYRPVIEYHGKVAKKVAREMRAKAALTSGTRAGTFRRVAAGGKTR